jgi:hypothetical protein
MILLFINYLRNDFYIIINIILKIIKENNNNNIKIFLN